MMSMIYNVLNLFGWKCILKMKQMYLFLKYNIVDREFDYDQI